MRSVLHRAHTAVIGPAGAAFTFRQESGFVVGRWDDSGMSDESKYDPDRMVFEDLDHSDPEVVMAYLEHPVTEALTEDLGRAFQQEPVEVKREAWQRSLARLQEQRRQLVEGPGPSAEMSDENRLAIAELLLGLDGFIERYKNALAVLENR